MTASTATRPLDVRVGAYFGEVLELAARMRDGYAEVLGAEAEDVALTGSTTDGLNTVLGGLSLVRRARRS